MKIFLVVLVLPFLLLGCGNECENGYKIKKEHKTIFWEDKWHKSSGDTILDGAIRISTITFKEGRVLTLRCFIASSKSKHRQLDIRYSINTPLISQMADKINKAGVVSLVLNADGRAIGSVKTRAIKHDDGISFLGKLDLAMLNQLAAAKDKLIAMPRQNSEKLDAVIKFGTAELSKHIIPVIEGCKEKKTSLEKPAG